jgi:ribosome-associated protein
LSSESRSLTAAVVQSLMDRKAEDILVLDISEVSLIADYFVLCTCRSNPHINSVNEALDQKADELATTWHRKEGSAEAGWILHDFSSVIVHLFLPAQREYYSLERLWRDARATPVESFLAQSSDPT